MINCTEQGLKEIVKEGKPVVVIAHTDWCCECRRVLPLLKALETDKQYKRSVVFAEINADTVSDTYIRDFGVQLLPTINVVTTATVYPPCKKIDTEKSIKEYIDACLI